MKNKGADQTARMCRLICAFVVRIWQKQVFSWRGSYLMTYYDDIIQRDDDNVCKYICHRPDWNLGRSGICLGQIRILIWPRPGEIRILIWPRQIPDLPRFQSGLRHMFGKNPQGTAHWKALQRSVNYTLKKLIRDITRCITSKVGLCITTSLQFF